VQLAALAAMMVYRSCLSARGYVREKLVTKPSDAHRGIEQYD
jgi:hypothetical protein